MKKNVSINISGIIFYIEEDGYERLKIYLDSINRYFSKFDDSVEIISDIESRIAEIFLAKLKDGRQVVAAEDVESLIATMGSIEDFKAVEEPEPVFEENQSQDYSPPEPGKRLFRDIKKKVFGGVAAGMGQYFNIDPLWIRLVFLVFFITFFFEFEISIAIGVIYIVLWIIIPGSEQLDYKKRYKKMFRNPDDKVLGGVAGGMAAFFGIDVVAVRLLFVIFIFLGFSGLIAYVILWIILPEAKTLTDKMEMQGEPVTLSNIEANVKKSFNVTEGEENILVKILLFPFRLIALLINALSKGLGPLLKFLVEAIRILAGILIVITAISCLVGLIILSGVLIGIFAGGQFEFLEGFPLEAIKNLAPASSYFALFFFLFIPFLFLAILGMMIMTTKNMIRATAGWTLFALWVVSAIVAAISVPAVVSQFARETEREEEEYFNMENKTAVLTLRTGSSENRYDFVTLRLRGHEQDQFRLVKEFVATGRNRQEAALNTQMVEYRVAQKDSILIFDPNLYFKEDAIFRMQRLSMTLFIPYEFPFQMKPELADILKNTLYQAGYSPYDMQDNTWIFTEKGLNCITCHEDPDISTAPDTETAPRDTSGGARADKTFNISRFHSLDVGGTYVVEIIPQPEFLVEAYGESRDLNSLEIDKSGNTLRIRTSRDDVIGQRNLRLVIGMPEIRNLDLHGGSKVYVRDLRAPQLDIDLSGAASAEINLTVEALNLEMSGSTRLILSGAANAIEADLSGIAALEATDCAANDVRIEAGAASKAQLNVLNSLRAETNGGGAIQYRGDPGVLIHSEGSVTRID